MKLVSVFLVLLCLFVFVAACNKLAPNTRDITSTTAIPGATPAAIKVTPADLAKLKWIEGTWRGTGDVQKPFYERYHFENESTLVMEELPDEKATTATDMTRYELKDGKFGTDRAVATAFDDKSITFSPLVQGRNSFRFQSESRDQWKAILTLPASGTKPAKETIYIMERVK